MSRPADFEDGLAPLRVMIGGLSIPSVWEIERALTRRLYPCVSAAQIRVKELGPLALLLVTYGTGNAVDSFRTLPRECYDERRPPDALRSAVLVDAYGSWRKVCRAADGLLADGRHTGSGKPWRSHAGAGPQRLYSDRQLADAVRACSASLLRRPSSNDYYRWRRAHLGHLRRAGSSSRVPSVDTIISRLGGWRRVLARAAISDADLAGWTAQKLSAMGVPGERVRLPTSHAANRRNTDNRDVATGSELLLALPLSEALALAHTHEASLDWLAGRTRERSPAARVDARLDGARFGELRRRAGVPEELARQRLRLPLGPYRQLLRGRREPSLGQLTAMASVIGVPISEILDDS